MWTRSPHQSGGAKVKGACEGEGLDLLGPKPELADAEVSSRSLDHNLLMREASIESRALPGPRQFARGKVGFVGDLARDKQLSLMRVPFESE